jgi:hypothetical protein
MQRCDTEVIPNLTQFHVRPLAVGAPAPASVVNRDLSVLLSVCIQKPFRGFPFRAISGACQE